MATWRDLVHYIKFDSSYRVIREEPDEIRIEYKISQYAEDDEARTQVMILAREVMDRKEDWVQIATPFAKVDQVDLPTVLADIGLNCVVGGAVVMGEYLVLRHSLPLANLDGNEFEDPLELVANSADDLEERFVGGDQY
ncbi:MAG TPA: hypothetical protein VG317_13275 [Pseudonocardiaceae bacterium]|nr:hypothetical protein [Pseudonocardiaceae bacterium]